MCLTAQALKASFCIRLNKAQGVPRLLVHSLHPLVLLSHDVSPFVPDFVPLFSPGLEGSGVEKMLLEKKKIKR